MEQILIRNLPVGTKAALRARAAQRHRSVEAEACDVLAEMTVATRNIKPFEPLGVACFNPWRT